MNNIEKNFDFDFDLDHYSLEELLALFKMPLDFDEDDMRRAKKTVLQVHPDKSKLPPKYFLFYSKAYKLLFSLWEFKHKNNTTQAHAEYMTEDYEKQGLLHSFFKENDSLTKSSSDFNRWFNEAFEKNREPEENGYSDWFHNNDLEKDPIERVTTLDAMAQQFERKKEKARSLVVYQEIQDFALTSSLGASELSSSDTTFFDSGLFSSLPFQDLKKAHEETVIPVTEKDFASKIVFRNVNELLQFRGRQDVQPLSEIEAEAFLREKKQSDEMASTKRSYDLARQTERIEKKQNGFWTTLQTLTDKKK